MQLGVLLANLEDESNAAAALEAIGDIVLYAEVLEACTRHDEAPDEYVSGAVRRFTSKASDEDWLGLMNAVGRGEDPGRTVLQRILQWALAQDASEDISAPHSGCSCQGERGGSHDHF